MIRVSCKSQGWLLNVLEAVRLQGWALVEDVLSHAMLAKTREAVYWVQRTIHQEVGEEKLQRAGELGILRLMLKFEPIFISFLEQDEVIAIIDSTATPTAILHLQNGFVLPSFPRDQTPRIFHNRFRQDFRASSIGIWRRPT